MRLLYAISRSLPDIKEGLDILDRIHLLNVGRINPRESQPVESLTA